MEINLLSVLLCGVAAMIVGMIWHGQALFGKTFMKALGADINMPPEKMKEIQKKMWQLYILQFILVLFQAWILAKYLAGAISFMAPLSNALMIWAGFVLPTIAGSSMWSARPRKDAWTIFFVSAGYSLILFIIFTLILKSFM